jgi:hypothetical protein
MMESGPCENVSMEYNGASTLKAYVSRFRDRASWAIILLVLISAFLYYPALKGSFVYYDRFEIGGNPAVITHGLWLQNFTYSARTAMAGRGYYYRPLYFLTYWVVYRLAGLQPLAFHLIQLVLYAATVWMLFRLGQELSLSAGVAFAGALLWAVHPLHVEVVAWISSLCDVGCTLFYFWAFRLFLRTDKTTPEEPLSYLPSALVFLGALLFKEMAFSFPLLILAYWFFVSPREPWAKRMFRLSPYAAAFCLYLVARISVLGQLTAGSHPWDLSAPLLLRSLTLWGEHTRLFIWPTHLTLARTAGMQNGPIFPWPAVALLGLAIAFACRKREPVLGFLMLWWPMALAPCLDVRQIPLPYVADRFSYLPSAGLCLAISYVLLRWLPQRFSGLPIRHFGILATAVVVVLWAWQTSRTIPHWHDEDVFSDYSVREAPSIPVFHTVRGRVLATERHDLTGAIQEYETALKLSRMAPKLWPAAAHAAHMGLANIAKEKGEIAEAAKDYELAAADMPANSFAYRELALLYRQQGDISKSAQYLSQVVKLDPHDLAEQFDLGVCLLKLHRYHEAAAQFDRVASINPDFPHLWEAKSQALLHAGAW